MSSEVTQALLKALEAGNYNAIPTDLVQKVYPVGGDPVEHQQECRCDIKDLMSTGHSPNCPERIVRELQKK